ncbi:MAG: hypothetical protein RML35_07775 [Chloroherpetonaceae bacterium]|nr:hypothetical protein [Chloroherpetonaceae bacterium]
MRLQLKTRCLNFQRNFSRKHCPKRRRANDLDPMKRPSAPTDAAACRQLLTKALTHAPEYRFRLSSLCHALQLSERKLWQLCQDCFGQTPKALMDWARAKTFLQVVELEPELKLSSLGEATGF